MSELFRFIDGLQFRGNIFREHTYFRKVIFWFSTVMIPLWVVLGFDSGMGMVENAIINLPSLLLGEISLGAWSEAVYSVYGWSFHFSAFVIYGYLFCGFSVHLQRLDILRSKKKEKDT